MEIKGTLVAIGGKEDKGAKKEDTQKKDFHEGILAKILELSPSEKPKVAFITAASEEPEELLRDYRPAFEKLGNNEFHHINIIDRSDLEHEEHITYMEHCDCVFFSGGDQVKLTEIISNSRLWNVLYDRYLHSNIVIAGTSAGAMAMSKHIIANGDPEKSHLKSEVDITEGLGFLDSIVIDTHFSERGRINRLSQAILCSNKILGIGIGEDTAVIIRNGNKIKVIGSGVIMIVDGTKIKYNNLEDIGPGEPLSIEHMVLHMLSEFDQFDIARRSFNGHE